MCGSAVTPPRSWTSPATLDLAIDRNIDLHGVLMRPGRDRLYELAAEVAAGVRPTVTDTYPLERAADAHRRLEAGRVGGKLVITL